MARKFRNPAIQKVAELILTDEELRLMIVNGGTNNAAGFPVNQEYYKFLEDKIETLRGAADSIERLLTLADLVRQSSSHALPLESALMDEEEEKKKPKK